ncbi:IS21 family transposase [uncultured Stenotrophomonas sp.]|uniref:IS21 family transposase n=1 Tax=uncultured Stenotrophomonas sp. TaxID=165438 RepID=UPI0026001AC0|nr:IS21 family transposase [uncultured Stenotrophomonas sp.]
MTLLKKLCRCLLRTDLSHRQIAQKVGRSPSTVCRYRKRLRTLKAQWEDIQSLDEVALDRWLNPNKSGLKKLFVEPNWDYIHTELQRRGVTLALLHEEYAINLGSGAMSATEFRRRYRRHARSRGLVMRQVRMPGHDLFLDFSGVRPSVTDPKTGQKTPVELFVAVMGASRKTFAYAVHSQKSVDWITCNAKALSFFGGVPTYLVPDNLKAAVTSISRQDGALLNMTYAEFASHYETTVLPARPRKPKDKAPVEIGVLLVQRWVLARLRNRTFFSLEELNLAIAELIERFNERPMRGCGGKSRQQLFKELDAPALSPLPSSDYEYADWKLNVPVGQDYHVSWDGHFYSVPHRLVGSKINLKATGDSVSAYHRDKRIALHVRKYAIDGCSTLPEHQPPAHRAYSQDTLDHLMDWAKQQAGALFAFVQRHSEIHRRPVLTLQACRGLQRLAHEHGIDRLQAACDRAVRVQANSIRSVKSILVRQLDRAPVAEPEAVNEDDLPMHENVRGAHYYS